MAQKQTKKAEQGKEPLKCTYKNCQKLQCADGEFCKKHCDKRYEIDVCIKFTQVEYAKSKKLAIQQVKYTFADEYNLDLTNKEIEAVRG